MFAHSFLDASINIRSVFSTSTPFLLLFMSQFSSFLPIAVGSPCDDPLGKKFFKTKVLHIATRSLRFHPGLYIKLLL